MTDVWLSVRGPRGPQWPLRPLLEVTGWSKRELSRRTGISMSTLDGRRGGLSDAVADRAAVLSGYHPLQIWPDWCDGILYDEIEDGAA